MLHFRDSWPDLKIVNLDQLATALLTPQHFLLAPGLTLSLEHRASVSQRWEIHRGRLLPPNQTRQEQTFEEWNLYLVEQGGSPEGPLLSLKFDQRTNQLHVVRCVQCHVWEGHPDSDGSIQAREVIRWVPELCGSVALDGKDVLDELVCQVFHAVVGASRLPLTSVETPLPHFALGRLGYFFRPGELNRLERIKWLELRLHATAADDMPRLVEELRPFDSLDLLRGVFNEVSLSPWTDLADKTLLLLGELERQGRVTGRAVVDFLADLTLQITRHLTAYDLITFHHRGANYPDALLLDVVLKELLRRVEAEPELLLTPDQVRRRRALRQGWLIRRSYENLPVPDAPTSPGENVRVLPPPHVRVPEEQILQPTKRRLLLYADDPLTRHLGPQGQVALQLALSELNQPKETLELGLALFLDRPFSAAKQPGEPDQTVLLSHRAFSLSLARRRLQFLKDSLGATAELCRLEVQGVPLSELAGTARPGGVSVADARRVAEDFVFLSTSPATVRELYAQYDFSRLWEQFALDDVRNARGLLVVPLEASGALTIHDRALRPRVLLLPDARLGFVRRAGREVLRGGLQAVVLDDADPVLVPLPPSCG